VAALAAEGKEVLISAALAADTGKSVSWIPAIQVIPDHLRCKAAPVAVLFGISLIPYALQLLEVILNELEVRAMTKAFFGCRQ